MNATQRFALSMIESMSKERKAVAVLFNAQENILDENANFCLVLLQ